MKFRTISTALLFTVYAVCGLALVVFMVPATGFQAKAVATGSMEPTIPTGSLVIIRKTPLSQLQPGDVVTYLKTAGSNVTVTHRIVARSEQSGIPYFTTKGDANPGPDMPIPGGMIVGKVVFHVPYVGSVTSAIKTPLALVFLIILPGMFIIVSEAGRMKRTLAAHPKVAPDDHAAGKTLVVLILAAVGLGIGTTHAQFTTKPVRITGIRLAVAGITTSPTPTPSHTPSPSPSHTPTPTPSPSGGTNTHTSNTNVINITNDTHQSVTTGAVNAHGNTSNGTTASGSASNTSLITTILNILNLWHP